MRLGFGVCVGGAGELVSKKVTTPEGVCVVLKNNFEIGFQVTGLFCVPLPPPRLVSV